MTMKTTNKLEQFKSQTRQIGALKKTIERILKARAESSKPYITEIDKHQDGFSADPNASGITVKARCFRSVTGYFGSSSVYSDIQSSPFMEDCLLEAMNCLKDDIISKTLEIMQSKTDALKAEAKKEYDSLMAEFDA